ncbi:BTB/POZ domain-containing protein 1-like [Culicoides brevitarsis]|uniref:BTB/POZ domain-containing protein 1-like n=1 Tax=Culicoides brevitarsis TaxID=469753 RepID=UPI00307C4B93
MTSGIFSKERQLAFFEEQKHCNVKFVFVDPNDVSGEATIEAHQLVLAINSAVFEAMFYGANVGSLTKKLSSSEDPSKVLVDISDVKFSVFKQMLSAMYGKEVQFDDVESACEFYYAVHKYNFEDAVGFVEIFLLKNLTSENAILILETAETFNNDNLKAACLKIFKENTLEILADESFLNAEISTVETLFKQDSLQIESEMDLVKALERYIEHTEDRTGIIEKLRPAVNSIRFLTLSFEQLAEVVSRYPILSSDEVLNVMSCLLPDKNCSKMPKGLSVSRQIRHNSVDCCQMARLLSNVYSSKFCPHCLPIERPANHPIWLCPRFSNFSKKIFVKNTYLKYGHAALMEYSYNDLKKIYQLYVDCGFVKK